jgi:hypothetical protein
MHKPRASEALLPAAAREASVVPIKR